MSAMGLGPLPNVGADLRMAEAAMVSCSKASRVWRWRLSSCCRVEELGLDLRLGTSEAEEVAADSEGGLDLKPSSGSFFSAGWDRLPEDSEAAVDRLEWFDRAEPRALPGVPSRDLLDGSSFGRIVRRRPRGLSWKCS
mmetsp:Transcript_27476/g.64023  ORF Transcript_27476/g.64023 Transcript_27476/m.64023 type:complete len:138 (-) Transcript_27476:710-1123(-)